MAIIDWTIKPNNFNNIRYLVKDEEGDVMLVILDNHKVFIKDKGGVYVETYMDNIVRHSNEVTYIFYDYSEDIVFGVKYKLTIPKHVNETENSVILLNLKTSVKLSGTIIPGINTVSFKFKTLPENCYEACIYQDKTDTSKYCLIATEKYHNTLNYIDTSKVICLNVRNNKVTFPDKELSQKYWYDVRDKRNFEQVVDFKKINEICQIINGLGLGFIIARQTKIDCYSQLDYLMGNVICGYIQSLISYGNIEKLQHEYLNFVAVVNDECADLINDDFRDFYDRGFNYTFISESDWLKKIKNNDIEVFEMYSADGRLETVGDINKYHSLVKLDTKKIMDAVLSGSKKLADTAQVGAAGGEDNVYTATITLFNAIRIFDFGFQAIKNNGIITDFNSMDAVWEKSSSMMWQKTWKQIVNELKPLYENKKAEFIKACKED